MKFPITDFFNKYDKVGKKMQIWFNLLKKNLMEKPHICAV